MTAPGTPLPDMQNGYNSLYLRREFTVVDPSAIESLVLTVDFFTPVVDDANSKRSSGGFSRRGSVDKTGTPAGEGKNDQSSHLLIHSATITLERITILCGRDSSI